VEEPSEAFYRKYLGGQAMGLYYLLKESPAGVDPLAAEAVLAVTLSVVTGAPISGQSRVMVNAKSPLTGAIGDSQAGGFWPAEAKAAGFDAVIIKGKAERPVYLWLHNGEAEGQWPDWHGRGDGLQEPQSYRRARYEETCRCRSEGAVSIGPMGGEELCRIGYL